VEKSDSEPDEPAEVDGTEGAEIGTYRSNFGTAQKLKYAYGTEKLCYQCVTLGVRPRIPKVHCNTIAYEMMSAINQDPASNVGNADNLTNLA
jgi:hypothetical protein